MPALPPDPVVAAVELPPVVRVPGVRLVDLPSLFGSPREPRPVSTPSPRRRKVPRRVHARLVAPLINPQTPVPRTRRHTPVPTDCTAPARVVLVRQTPLCAHAGACCCCRGCRLAGRESLQCTDLGCHDNLACDAISLPPVVGAMLGHAGTTHAGRRQRCGRGGPQVAAVGCQSLGGRRMYILAVHCSECCGFCAPDIKITCCTNRDSCGMNTIQRALVEDRACWGFQTAARGTAHPTALWLQQMHHVDELTPRDKLRVQH